MPPIGKTLIMAGLALTALGLLFLLGEKLPFQLGKLPGDLEFRGKNSVVYLPLGTCLLLSLLGSLLLWVIRQVR
jgi:hypothetical protein